MVIGKVVLKALAVFLLLQATAFAQEGKDMSPALRKQLNVFFSNFSEVNLPNFKKGQLSDKMLVDFALWHCTFNLTNTLKKSKDGAHALADASLIDNICMRYFGVKPGKHKVKTYDVDLASGEAYIFSQVDKLTKVNQDTYTAQGTIYYTGSDGTPARELARAMSAQLKGTKPVADDGGYSFSFTNKSGVKSKSFLFADKKNFAVLTVTGDHPQLDDILRSLKAR